MFFIKYLVGNKICIFGALLSGLILFIPRHYYPLRNFIFHTFSFGKHNNLFLSSLYFRFFTVAFIVVALILNFMLLKQLKDGYGEEVLAGFLIALLIFVLFVILK